MTRNACPVCAKQASAAEHPFCSRRCADVDLLRWLNGAYAIPGQPADDDLEPPPPEGRRPENMSK
jgi:hypothetical protein